MRLKQLQTLIYERITTPEGGARARRQQSLAECAIRGDAGLTAAQRLQIYVDAYFLRLLGCLKEDFPATSAVVGRTRFETLARSYLTKHRPTEPSIDHAGRRFPEFLRDHSILSRFPFLAELAQLEQAIADVFVALDCPALGADEMRSLAPQDWPTFMLQAHPASQLLEFKWKVIDVRRSVENVTPWGTPTPEPNLVLVWRQQAQVYFRELEPAEHEAFRVTTKGANFSTICETLARNLDNRDPAQAINQLLARWLADGVLVGSTPA